MTRIPNIIPSLIAHLQGLDGLKSITAAVGLEASTQQSLDHQPTPMASVFIHRLHAKDYPQLSPIQQRFIWKIGVLLAVTSPDHWGNAAINDNDIETLLAKIIERLAGFSPHGQITPLEFRESNHQKAKPPRIQYLIEFECSGNF